LLLVGIQLVIQLISDFIEGKESTLPGTSVRQQVFLSAVLEPHEVFLSFLASFITHTELAKTSLVCICFHEIEEHTLALGLEGSVKETAM
jgi:hypothetical protein